MTRSRSSTEKVPAAAKCTACTRSIKTSVDACLHPLLLVLICRKCYKDYGTGDYSVLNDPDVGPGVDDLGYDNYCRWCVDGGELFECSMKEREDPTNCRYAFCKKCIEKHCPNDEVLNVVGQKDNEIKWKCFACDPSKLKAKRKEAQDVIIALNQKDLKRPIQKATNLIALPKEQITPVAEFRIKELELKSRLEAFKKIASGCTSEIGGKFETIIEMFQSRDLEDKTIIKTKLDDIEKPIHEFNTMLKDLRSLYSSQS